MSYFTLNAVAGRGYFWLFDVQLADGRRREGTGLETHDPRREWVPEGGTFFKSHRTFDVRESKLQLVPLEAVQLTPEDPSPR